MSEAFDAFAERIPLAAILGFRLLEEGAGRARLAMEPRRDMLQGDARVHGGVLATLADTAAVWAVARDLPEGRAMTSIEFKLNFLAPVVLDGGEVAAGARVVRRGRSVAVVDAELQQAGAPVAKGLFTYLLYDRGGRP